MGRVAAIFHRGGKRVESGELELLYQSLAVARPNGAIASKFLDGPMGLLAVSHGRPADPNAFHVPQNSDRFVVLFDGSLFNRLEVAAELGLRSTGLEIAPLGVVAARAWAKWGTDAVKHLDGNFLLIVWDRLEQRLFAGRDCVGTTPLFYRLTENLLILATQPRALFAVGDGPPALRIKNFASGLSGLGSTDNQSIFEGAWHLPAAHTLNVDRSSHRLTQFWSVDPDAPQLKLPSDQDYVDQARHLLDSAVRLQVRGAGTVASEITGGLDSSTVAVTALQFLGEQKRLPVYTHVPEAHWDGSAVPGWYGDETPYIRDMAKKHERLEPISVSTDHTSWDGVLNQYFAAGEWLAPVPRWLAMSDEVFRDANRRGVNVMLNGLSGNATLSWEGRGAFIQWLREGRITTLLRELHAVAPGMVPFARAFVSRVVVPLGPDWVWRIYSRLKYHREPTTFWREYSFIRPEFALAHGVDERSDDFPPRPPADYRQTRAEMLSPQSNFGQDEGCAALKSMYDIEYRDPLRDRQLIEWCMRVPEEQYWRHGQGRWLVRRVMAGRLPESVLNSRQRGQQGADWHAHLTRQLPFIREQIDVLSADSDVAAMIDFDAIKKALDDWPQASITDDDQRRYKLSIALPQALATARFVRWTKGANLRLFHSPHCVDTERFAAGATSNARQELRTRLGVESSKRLVLFAGKLVDFKRPCDVVDATAMLRTDGLDAEVLIAGAGPLEGALRMRATERGVPVHWLGFQNQSQMPAAYAAADALVLPSTARETWGLVCNEAIACGTPIVVSDVVGCAPDLATDGCVGRTFAMGNTSECARALAELFADPPRVSELSKASSKVSVEAAVHGIRVAVDAVTQRRMQA